MYSAFVIVFFFLLLLSPHSLLGGQSVGVVWAGLELLM